LVSASEKIALDITEHLSNDALIAINHAGALPYFLLEHRFLDMTGLNDHRIARVDGGLHQKYDVDYIFERQPDYVVLNSRSKLSEMGFVADYWIGETALFEDSRFKENYVPISQAWKRVQNGGGLAYIALFQRRRAKKKE
jgi:hypothetical protein